MSFHRHGITFLLLKCSSSSRGRRRALTFPPWRGPRQLLSNGPWGPILDLPSSPPINDAFGINAGGSSRILPITEHPPRSDGHRCIVAILVIPIANTDVFRFHPAISCVIVAIFCNYFGDLGGVFSALLDFCPWFGEIPAKNIIVIGGNHDRLLEKMGDTAVQNILKWRSGAISLHDDSVQLANLVVYGSPWSPPGKTGNRAFQRRRSDADASKEVSLAFHCEHQRVDVLLTHASSPQWDTVVQTKGTAFGAHGHWHDGQGRIKNFKNGCISINDASNDMLYRPQNPPADFDVPVDDANRTTTR